MLEIEKIVEHLELEKADVLYSLKIIMKNKMYEYITNRFSGGVLIVDIYDTHTYYTSLDEISITSELSFLGYLDRREIGKIAYPLVYKQDYECALCGSKMLFAQEIMDRIMELPRDQIDYILDNPDKLDGNLICCECYINLTTRGSW
jgi:hypothetical protein